MGRIPKKRVIINQLHLRENKFGTKIAPPQNKFCTPRAKPQNKFCTPRAKPQNKFGTKSSRKINLERKAGLQNLSI